MLAPATDGNAGVGCDIRGSAAMPARALREERVALNVVPAFAGTT
jgi:hypothetical protein